MNISIKKTFGKLVAIFVIASYSCTSFAQVTSWATKKASERKRPLVAAASCMQRVVISEKGAEYKSAAGTKITWETNGKKILKVSNGKDTATALYEGDKLVGANLSNGQAIKLRHSLTADERALLPQKIKRLKQLMARVYLKECNIGASPVAAGKFLKTGDGEDDWQDEWDSSWDSEEFWDSYFSDTFNPDQIWSDIETLPRMTCTQASDTCRDDCDLAADIGMIGCGAMSAAFAALSLGLSIALGAVCGAEMLIARGSCRTQCEPARIECVPG